MSFFLFFFSSPCVRDLIFLSREGRDLGVAFQAPPGSQASSRGEAKDSALLSSRDAGLLEPPERAWRGGARPGSRVTGAISVYTAMRCAPDRHLRSTVSHLIRACQPLDHFLLF